MTKTTIIPEKILSRICRVLEAIGAMREDGLDFKCDYRAGEPQVIIIAAFREDARPCFRSETLAARILDGRSPLQIMDQMFGWCPLKSDTKARHWIAAPMIHAVVIHHFWHPDPVIPPSKLEWDPEPAHDTEIVARKR